MLKEVKAMKKWSVISACVFMLMAILCFFVVSALEQKAHTVDVLSLTEKPFFGGSGTEEDPYLISTLNNLNNIRYFMYKRNADGTFDTSTPNYFKQINDLTFGLNDLNGASAGNFDPIGDAGAVSALVQQENRGPFAGQYDGHNYTIRGLNMNSSKKEVGLFGAISSTAVVMNIAFKDNVTTSTYAGTDGSVGGLIGTNYGEVKYCYSTSNVSTLTSNECGGLVGLNNGDIIDCYNTGITNGSNVGGIVGSNAGGLYGVYNTGAVPSSGGAIGHEYVSGVIEGAIWLNTSCATTTAFKVGSPANTSGSSTPAIRSVTDAQLKCVDQISDLGEDDLAVAFLAHSKSGYSTVKCNQYFYSPDAQYLYPMLWSCSHDLNYRVAGHGTLANPHNITSPQQLSAIGSGITIDGYSYGLDDHYVIARSLYFHGVDTNGEAIPGNFTQICKNKLTGQVVGPFNGTITAETKINSGGKDIVLSGLIISGAEIGLVASLGEDGVVDGITIQDFHPDYPTSSLFRVGTICVANRGTVKNCSNFSDLGIELTAAHGATGVATYITMGGIVASNEGIIENCRNIGNLSATYSGASGTDTVSCVGGITSINIGIIKRCYNQGNCTGGWVGGIVASTTQINNLGRTLSITTCFNTGDIVSHVTDQPWFAGIAGVSLGSNIDYCYNLGKSVHGAIGQNYDAINVAGVDYPAATYSYVYNLNYNGFTTSTGATAALTANQFAGQTPVSGSSYFLDIMNNNPDDATFLYNRFYLGVDSKPYQFANFSNMFAEKTLAYAMNITPLGWHEVRTPEQFMGIGKNTYNGIDYSTGGWYAQMNDIDFNNLTFSPALLSGGAKYDGTSSRLTNASIVANAAGYYGLFSQIIDSSIYDIQAISLSFNCSRDNTDVHMGGLTANAVGTTQISGVEIINSTLTARHDLGGLVGWCSLASGGYIRNCAVRGTTVANSETGNNTAERPQGGFVGAVDGTSLIEKCYYSHSDMTSGSVKGNFYMGGFVGKLNGANSIIRNCYSHGSIYNYHTTYHAVNYPYRNTTGGFFGSALAGTITNCYAYFKSFGANLQTSGVGFRGMVYSFGWSNGANVSNCYSLSGQTIGKNAWTNAATEVSEAQLQTQGTFSGWDFASTWQMSSGSPSYGAPHLRNIEFTVTDHDNIYVICENNCTVQLWSGNTIIGINNSEDMGGAYFPLVSAGIYKAIVYRYGQSTVGITPTNAPNVEVLTIVSVSNEATFGRSIDWFGGGKGIESDPYIISTLTQFQKLTNMVNAVETVYYKQINNISNLSNNWTPIESFNGYYNGGGYQLYNFVISESSGNVGIFRNATNATFKNLNLLNCFITNTSTSTANWTGSLVGFMQGSLVESCSVTYGPVNVYCNGGGLVGYALNSTIKYSSSNISVASTNESLTSISTIGGLAGKTSGCEIRESYSMSDMIGTRQVGGFIGVMIDTDVIDCFTRANVDTNYSGAGCSDVGGFVGYADGLCTFTRCYQKGGVNTDSLVLQGEGTFGGNIETTSVVDCYYWSINAFDPLYSGTATINPLNTTEYLIVDSFNNYDFIDTWGLPENGSFLASAPVLRRATLSGPISEQIMGTGTVDDPYLLYTEQHFEEIRTITTDDFGNPYPYFKMMKDVRLPTTFVPVGTAVQPFTGSFDGNLKECSGLALSSTTSTNDLALGLFGHVENAEIKGVVLHSSTITVSGLTSTNTNCYVGTVAAVATNSIFYDCHVNSTIAGENLTGVGGIVGKAESCSFDYCYSTGTFANGVSTATNVGGIVGHSFGSQYSNSIVALATIVDSANMFSGGIVGLVDTSAVVTVIKNCTSQENTIQSGFEAGGIVGRAKAQTTISGCKTINTSVIGGETPTLANPHTGDIDGSRYCAGGIAGALSSSSTTLSCLVSSVTIGGDFVGGIIGESTPGNSIVSCTVKSLSSGSTISAFGGGGIVGLANGTTVLGCVFIQNSTLSMQGFVGGIAGSFHGANSTMTDCIVNTIDSTAGGMVGLYIGALCGTIHDNPIIQYNKIANFTVTSYGTGGIGTIFGFEFATPTTNVNNNYSYNVTIANNHTSQDFSQAQTLVSDAESNWPSGIVGNGGLITYDWYKIG